MFCPTCASSNVDPNPSPNVRTLYVAQIVEEMYMATEFFDNADPWKCKNCNTAFYVGGPTDDGVEDWE